MLDRNASELTHRLNSVERQLGELRTVTEEQGTALQRTIESATAQTKYQHQNLVRNGDLDFNRNTYLYTTDFSGGTGEDANVSEEAAHFFSHPAAATELREDSTDVNADADLATNTAIKTSAHTRYGTTVNNPDYDKGNGWIRWSDAANTIDVPLPYNWVYPSKQFILSFIYKLANDVDGEEEVFCPFFAGIWDNTSGQRKYLEGAQPTLSGTAVGTTGATSRDYFVVMYQADGTTVGTNTATVANTNATIDSTNYVQLSWSQPPGVVRSEIYRKTGATYELVGFPYPASTFYDRGTVYTTVGSFPATTRTTFRAYVQVTEDNFAPASSAEWRLGQINIAVPPDYNMSLTTDKQWLRIGLASSLSGTDSTRALLVDLISLDSTYGLFSKCPLDFQAKRGVVTAPTSSDQGTTGGDGGGGYVEPGGGNFCPTFDEMVLTDRGEVRAIDLVDNEDRYRIVDRNGCPAEYAAEVCPAQVVYTLVAGDVSITASGGHRIFTDYTDFKGKRLKDIDKGDTILTRSRLVTVDAVIRKFKKRHVVRISLKGAEKGYWQNGVGVHNIKNDPL